MSLHIFFSLNSFSATTIQIYEQFLDNKTGIFFSKIPTCHQKERKNHPALFYYMHVSYNFTWAPILAWNSPSLDPRKAAINHNQHIHLRDPSTMIRKSWHTNLVSNISCDEGEDLGQGEGCVPSHFTGAVNGTSLSHPRVLYSTSPCHAPNNVVSALWRVSGSSLD